MNTVLLIDGSNSFVRHYSAHSATTSNGIPYGAVVGFLRSLRTFVDLVKPTKVVITFDAQGGSRRRRKILPEYKNGRKPMRLNRKFEIGADKEKENKKFQSIALLEYLDDLPVHVLRVPDVEADDVIGFLCGYFDESRKVIVSSDCDFNQLLDNNTLIYRPMKRQFYSQKDCYDEHGIHPRNFALARAFVGDRSDNIKGVPGVGFKTLIKLLPQFGSLDVLELPDLMSWCQQNENKRIKVLAEHNDLLKRNYSIMVLSEPTISQHNMSAIKSTIQQPLALNNTDLRLKVIRDGIDLGVSFFTTFTELALMSKLQQRQEGLRELTKLSLDAGGYQELRGLQKPRDAE